MSSAELQTTILKHIAQAQKLERNLALESKKRDGDIQKHIVKVGTAVDQLAALQGNTVSAAMLAFYKGKVSNCREAYDETAEASLNRSVKLDPSLVEGWNQLGMCYYKKNDQDSAKSSFITANGKQTNKESLRGLSLLVKNMGDAKTRVANIRASCDFAKQAIALDMSDAESWYVLGNALVASFFGDSQEFSVLERAVKAYNKAHTLAMDKDNASTCSLADLYYNRANVRLFLEDYQGATDDYVQCAVFDPTLPGQKKAEETVRFVRKVAKLVANKGGMKGKRLDALLGQLPVSAEEKKRKHVVTTNLTANGKPNTGKCCMGVVCAPVSRSSDTPTSFLVASPGADFFNGLRGDWKGCVFNVISLYNVTNDLLSDIRVGDYITILDPTYQIISVSEPRGDGSAPKISSYPCVQCKNPLNVMTNGKHLLKSQMTNATMTFSESA